MGILAVFLAFLLISSSFKNQIDAAAAWTIAFAQERPLRGAILFVLFAAVSAMLAFASSAVFVPPATLVWGTTGTFFLLAGGWTLGAAIAYGIGRLATPLIVRLGYQHKLEKYQRFVSSEMTFWKVLLFCLMVPSEVPGYLFGGAHYSLVKFLLAIGIAEAAYAFILVMTLENALALRPAHFVLLVGAGALAIVGVALVLRKFKKKP